MSITPKILDTFRLDSNGIFLKKFHVQRTFEASQFLNQLITPEQVSNLYDKIEAKLLLTFTNLKRVRIIFTENLDYVLFEEDLVLTDEPIRLQLLEFNQQKNGLGYQNFKWEDRSYWNQLLRLKSDLCDDIISVNLKNEITETSRFNLYFYSEITDIVYTPPLESGCINGVYRRFALENRKIELPSLGLKKLMEQNIPVDQLNSYQIFVANSVRGIISARVIVC